MENREIGLEEIYDRIKSQKDVLGISQFRRTPTSPIDSTPYIVMLEDVDEIVKKNARNPLGYPCVRDLEVIVELTVNAEETDIRSLLRQVRSAVFSGGAEIADRIFIREARTIGPFGYGVPEILGMRLILSMTYTDLGV